MGYQIQILFNKELAALEQQLCRDYWQCNQNKLRDFHYPMRDLSEKYHLSQGDISNFVKKHCQLILSDFHCVSCGKTASLSLRGQMTSLRLENWTCDSCFKQQCKATALAMEQTRVETAKKRREEQEQIIPPFNKPKFESETYTDSHQTPSFRLQAEKHYQKHTTFDILLLLTFVKQLIDIKTWASHRIYDIEVGVFSPSLYLDEILARYLYARGLVQPIDCTDNPKDIDGYRCQFRPLYSSSELREITFNLDSYDLQEVLADKQWAEIFKQLQIAECERYCCHLLQDRKAVFVSIEFSEYFTNIVGTWADTLSVAYITPILWEVIKDTNAQTTKDEPVEQYTNRLLKRLFEADERVRHTPPIRKFNRHRQIPPSPLATAIVDKIFGRADVVFNYCLKELLI